VIKLVIKINNKKCTHLKNISKYNHNYYELPIEIDGCRVLFEECDENYDSYTYHLGNLIDGKFVMKEGYWFASDAHGDEGLDNFLIDTELKEVIYT